MKRFGKKNIEVIFKMSINGQAEHKLKLIHFIIKLKGCAPTLNACQYFYCSFLYVYWIHLTKTGKGLLIDYFQFFDKFQRFWYDRFVVYYLQSAASGYKMSLITMFTWDVKKN